MNPEAFPVPPSEAMLPHLGTLVEEVVYVEDRVYTLAHPESDRLLKHPAVHAANLKDDYMPYWADLWPGARMLARAILHEPWTPGTEAIEIGCGLGLPGIVALSMGLKVTFSDYDPCALRFATDNARRNGQDGFQTLQLDWRHPPDDLRLPVILASDLVYEMRNVAPLVAFIKKVLAPGGVCLLTDPDRVPSHALRELLHQEGLPYTTRMMRAGEPGGRRIKGTLYRITK